MKVKKRGREEKKTERGRKWPLKANGLAIVQGKEHTIELLCS
jgi:hypothetical protein